jgi:hypothetical protein
MAYRFLLRRLEKFYTNESICDFFVPLQGACWNKKVADNSATLITIGARPQREFGDAHLKRDESGMWVFITLTLLVHYID